MSCRDLHRTRRRVAIALALAAIVGSTFAARAELPDWVRNVPAGDRWHDAIFRTLQTHAGPVEVRRSPADAHAALMKSGPPSPDRQLLALRARLAEEKLDQSAAEADWKAYAGASPDPGAGQLALADFYHRRLLPQQEADALAAAARAEDPPADRLLPVGARRSWQTFERIFALVDAHQLPDAFAEAQSRAWLARFPTEVAPYDRLFRFLVDRNRAADAEALLGGFQRAFPSNDTWVLKARAELATRRGATADALAVYDKAFRPLWDAANVQDYFALLGRTHSLRAFLDRARAEIAARPNDLTPVARVFYYYDRAGNVGAAEHVLSEFEARRENLPRTADELFTLAGLYEKTRNYNEALRYYASIYSLPGANPADVERALVRIIDALFTAPEQPLRFGSSDLSFYRDIATLDRGPGFLNGVLSLLFNSVDPSQEYARQEASATSYFHRARAVDLLGLLESRFPNSSQRARLTATLVSTYAAYGQSDAVIDRGRRFLAAFPDAAERTDVTLTMADAFARKDLVAEEFAAYDRLLEELAARADRVPLGAGTAYDASHARAAGARSQEYARVLDRYIARLVSRDQLTEALAVYRREIDRNPNDPGLYAATAQFLEQNNIAAEVEQVYRLAMQQFPDASWHHRLARWYLRREQSAAFETLTRDVTRTFEGTELARYFEAVVHAGRPVGAHVYLQLNLYAHERFPHHLVFVRNLLSAYGTVGTYDRAAWEALLRRHWFEDETLANTFFAELSRTNRLDAEMANFRKLAATPAAGADWNRLAKDHPLAARFLAEADIWRSQFESGTPVLSALAAEYPSDVELNQRAGSLHRSLSYVDARETDAAAQVFARLHQYDPRSVSALTTLGEVYADRERYDTARVHWDRLPDIEPGNPARYLEAATVFWDYYQFDDALRLIGQGRTRLKNPTLYAYEAGAIYEGLRQPHRAVDEYTRGALANESASPAQNRLLRLANRPTYRELVDRATAAAADSGDAGASAVSLRIAVLETQNRRNDIEHFLATLLDRTSSLEMMTDIGSHATRLGFEAIRSRALARQIESVSDPIEKLQGRYALVQLFESRGERDAARKTVEALYAEHPRVLGIVRQTVDFYWRHEQHREAIAVLTRAAAQSYPALKQSFTYEAALKTTATGDYGAARELLQRLLGDDPFNADYLAAVADTYARAGEDRALRDFYASRIEALRSAALSTEERTRRIAGMRRALIPALTRLKDHAGALDQYIEIINRYPDDEALLAEAGRYAREHARTAQLLAYYTKTAADSPRDYRWPMLLAKLHTQFEDYAAAIAAYAKAAAIRPDRSDFQIARGLLEERLMRFEDAVASYTRTYELTYRDPQWMEKVAELRARQGRVDDASKALRLALIEGRPPRAASFFEAARRLESWRMPEAAKPFVDEGVRLATPQELLNQGSSYVSVYTTLRQAPAVVDQLLVALPAADQSDGRAVDADDSGPRVALPERLGQLGDLVDELYSPEEKVRFAVALEAKRPAVSSAAFARWLVPLAERAGLLDLAVRWRTELMFAALNVEDNEHLHSLVDLQTKRLRFTELAGELERFADAGARMGFTARHYAADAYRKSGDVDGEFRMLSKIPVRALGGAHRQRYFVLLLERNPQRLTALTASEVRDIRDAAANFLVAYGTYDQALAGVKARGQGLPPVWTNAYSALVGLHFSRFDVPTTTAFTAALGDPGVAERLKPVDRSLQLAGDTWFAYASRFGEFRAFGKQPGAADYLPASVERTPARSETYVTLADFYRDTGAPASALAEYDHAATLNPNRSDVHLRAAAILWRQNRRPEAIERWKQAMILLTAQAAQTAGETEPLEAVLESIGVRKLLPELREPADKMVRAYVARNGTYRADGLLRAAFLAAGDPASGAEWLLDLAGAAPDQVETLGTIARASWLPDALRDMFYQRIVAVAEGAVTREHGVARTAKEGELRQWRVARIRSLVETKHTALAAELLRELPEDAGRATDADIVELETRIAAAAGTLESSLDRHARLGVFEANLDALRAAATALDVAGDDLSARRIMEFVYTRQLGRGELTPPVFLGLAEIRLQQGDIPAALALLRRLNLVVGEPFGQLAPSAALLERLNRPAEALEFRRARVEAVPWDPDAHVALARTEIAAAQNRDAALDRLGRIAESPKERYALRVQGALAFSSAGGRRPLPARTEIDWLRALPDLTPAAANRPMFVAARRAAAEQSTEPSVRAALLREAVAIDPESVSLRIVLFRALLATARPADAIEAVEPIVARGASLAGLNLTATERAQLAREIAEAYQNIDRLDSAVVFLRVAIETPPADGRAAIEQRIRTLNAEIARRAENDARRPHVSESLDQPTLVRPRLVARTTPQGGAR